MTIDPSNIDPRITASALNASPSLDLSKNEKSIISFSCAGAFAGKLQRLAADGATWSDSYENGSVVTIDSTTGRQTVAVLAGVYRFWVTTYNSAITMWGQPVPRR